MLEAMPPVEATGSGPSPVIEPGPSSAWSALADATDHPSDIACESIRLGLATEIFTAGLNSALQALEQS